MDDLEILNALESDILLTHKPQTVECQQIFKAICFQNEEIKIVELLKWKQIY